MGRAFPQLSFLCAYIRYSGMYACIAPLSDGYGDMGGLFFELCLIEFLKELAGIHDAVRAGTEDFASADAF